MDNREEVFVNKSKELSTHYVRNDSDRKSRYNDWRNNFENNWYHCSKSKPGYWKNDRVSIKSRYVRDDSRFRIQSNGARSKSRRKY